MIKQQIKRSGFTLMELLIAIAIVAILAAIAIPTYISYTQRAQYSEIVQAADQLKTTVAACIDSKGGGGVTDVEDFCDNGKFGIPAAGGAVGNVGSTTVVDGVILVTPAAVNGLAVADTYTLTPTPGVNGVTWAATCGGAASNYASNCQ